jgi:hypothetical protein
VCILATNSAHEAAGASGARHSPRPLFSGRMFLASLGRIAPRECEGVSYRHCERSEAIHAATKRKNGLLRCARNDDRRTNASLSNRHHPRKRVIQYSETPVIESISRSVLDTPLSRSMTTSWGRAKQSNPLFLFAALWIASRSLSSGAHSRDPLALPIPNFFLREPST